MDTYDTHYQLFENIAADEVVEFRSLPGALSVLRRRRTGDRVFSSHRMLPHDAMKSAKIDLLARLLWETAQEVRKE